MTGPDHLLALLARGVDFEAVRDVRFDVASGRLTFEGQDGSPRIVNVAPASRAVFMNSGVDSSADNDRQQAGTIDFSSPEAGALRLVVEGAGRSGGWDSGVLIRSAAGGAPYGGDRGMIPAMAAHELKQPLFTIGMAAKSIELMLGQVTGDDRLEGIGQATARIRLQVERAHAIMSGIIGYGQPAIAGAPGGDVGRAVVSAVDFLQPMLDRQGVAVTLDVPDEALAVPLPHVALEQVIVNAIQNAVDSLEMARSRGRQAGHVALSAHRDGDQVTCLIRDDGEGLRAGSGDEVFHPFFTTKSAQGSLGLGLHISRQIVTNAGGSIQLAGNDHHGATLSFTLPNGAAGEG